MRVCFQAMNCFKQLVSDSLLMVFDSNTILLSQPLPDTVIDVNQKSISLPLEKVFTDLTRHGYTLSSYPGDPEKATAFTENGQLICWPHQQGELQVFVTALDTFTGFRVTDTFRLRIERIYNTPPYVTGAMDTVVLQMERDTLHFLPDTLFSDHEDDTLYYSVSAGYPEIISITQAGNAVHILPVQPGETVVTIQADDHFGGTALLNFVVEVEKDSAVVSYLPATMDFGIRYDSRGHALVIDSPEDRPSVQIVLTGVSGQYSGLLFSGNLSAGNTCIPVAEGDFPSGVYILIIKENQQILPCGKIVVSR